MSEITDRNFGREGLNSDMGRKSFPERGMPGSSKRPAGPERDYSERENLHRRRERRDEYVGEFVREVIKDCKTPKEELIAVLRARGFLIDESDGEYYLSDNSCLKNPGCQCSSDDLDQVVLAGFLKGSNLGTIDMVYEYQDERKTVSIDPDHFTRHYYPGMNHPAKYKLNITGRPEYKHLLDVFRIYQGLEGSSIHDTDYGMRRDEDYFYEHEHGTKVPVCVIDAGIARFCKAVSACGITTQMACDGHFGEKGDAWIIFNTSLDLLWFRILNECIITPLLKPELKFIYVGGLNSGPHGDVSIPLNIGGPVPDYLEIQRVAKFLYDNRVIFRELKKDICKDYQNHYPGLDDLRDYERTGDIPGHILNQLRMRTNTLLMRELRSQQKLPYTEVYQDWMLRIFEKKAGISSFLTNINVMQEDYTGILEDLIKIYSPSGREHELSGFITRKYGGNRWDISSDELSNLYITPKDDNGLEELPLLNVHLDTYPLYFEGQEEEAKHIIKLSRYHTYSRFRRDNRIKPGFNAGFDDKAGVAMVLYLMKYTSLKFKAVFTVQEEQAVTCPAKYGRGGGGGIDYAIGNNPEFFKNSACVLTIDRQGGRDIIASYGFGSKDSPRLKLCSDEFLEKFIDVSKKVYHPMTVAKGSIADAYNIRAAFPNLDVLNISAGYYNEHRESEWLDLNDVFGVMRVVVGFLGECEGQSN